MSDKILFWIDADLIHYGLAKYLKDIHNCDLYSIFDITNKPKEFFKTQNLVKFKKFWFFHEHTQQTNDNPDVEYLSKFEKKYNINLWVIACNERIFFNYNEFYKFTTNEVLKILERECKFFEKILEEVMPDFLIMRAGDLQQTKIFYEMCKTIGIKVLLLGQTRFANRSIISPLWHEIDPIDNSLKKIKSNRTFSDLLNYLKGPNLFKSNTKLVNEFRGSKILQIKTVLEFLKSTNNNVKTHYTYYGRTKLRVLFKMPLLLIRGKIREFYINRNLIRVVNKKTPFFFFPLHVDQESTLLLGAPFHTNQIEIITNIIKSLPVGYQLYVKEHQIMKVRGWRNISFYKQLLSLPNIKVLHPSISPDEIMSECSGVIAITGTSALEAAFYQKPSIIFADSPFSKLPSVYRVKDVEELPKIIRLSLETTVDVKDLNEYVDFVENNSFQFNHLKLEQDFENHFYRNGNSVDVNITHKQMSDFLEQHREIFEHLASEHIKKIQYYKNLRNNQTT